MLLSQNFCCRQKLVFLLWYSGIVGSKNFHVKTAKWKFLLSTIPEYQSKKKKNTESAGERICYLKKDCKLVHRDWMILNRN